MSLFLYVLVLIPLFYILRYHTILSSFQGLTIISYIVYFYIGLNILNFDQGYFSKSAVILLLSMYSYVIGSFFYSISVSNYNISISRYINTAIVKREKKFKVLFVSSVCLIFGLFLFQYRDISFGSIHEVIIPFCFSLLFLSSLRINRNIIYIYVFIIFIMISLMISRHASLECLIAASLAYIYYKKIKLAYIWFISIILVFVFFTVMLYGQYVRSESVYNTTLDMEQLISIVSSRVFLIGAKTYDYIISSNLGENRGLILTRQFENLFTDNPVPSIGYEVCEAITGGTTCYDPVGVMGQFYFDFGLVGLIIGMSFFGFFSSYLFRKLMRKEKNLLNIAAMSYVSVVFMRTFAYSFNGIVFIGIQLVFTYYFLHFFLNLTTNNSAKKNINYQR